MEFKQSFSWIDKYYGLCGSVSKKRIISNGGLPYIGIIAGMWEDSFATYNDAELATLRKLKEIIIELKLEKL